jgi:amino acid adenylation domain-containing protein
LTELADPRHPLIDLIEGVARRAGEKAALVSGERRLTYAAVSDVTARLSARLRASVAPAASPVAALGPSHIEAGLGLVAALRAQRPYVVIEAGVPEARLAAVMDSLGSGTLLAGAATAALADSFRGRSFDVLGFEAGAPGGSPDPPDAPGDSQALAWIIFTSGSTGRPKGVMHTVASAHHSVLRAAESLRLVEDDRVAVSFAPSSLAGFVYPLSVLQTGATIFFLEPDRHPLPDLLRWLRDERITVLALVPTLFRRLARLMQNANGLPDLRYVRLTGETVTVTDLDLFRHACPPDCVLGVGYASTESGAITEAFFTRESTPRSGVVPVGRPHEGIEIDLVDANGRTVPAGEPGEIVVSGAFLSPGYWQRPDLTADAFSRQPDGLRRYRTGDLGIRRPDGALEHVGRVDSQVQILGRRVELSEIEVALRALEGIGEAAVQAARSPSGDVLLAAYAAVDGTRSLDGHAIREGLARTLPAYMLPARIVLMDALPLTRTGKIDRGALPDPFDGQPIPYVAPRTETEAVVAEIWADVLGVDRVGVHSDFLELGGDSIAAMLVAHGLETRFGAHIDLARILTVSTVAGVAGVVDELSSR